MIDIPVWELIAVRMALTWIGCIACKLYIQSRRPRRNFPETSFTFLDMKWAKTPHPFLGPPGVRILLCIRGIVGYFGLFGMYSSLRYLSLSDATVLSFISPVLVGAANRHLQYNAFPC